MLREINLHTEFERSCLKQVERLLPAAGVVYRSLFRTAGPSKVLHRFIPRRRAMLTMKPKHRELPLRPCREKHGAEHESRSPARLQFAAKALLNEFCCKAEYPLFPDAKLWKALQHLLHSISEISFRR